MYWVYCSRSRQRPKAAEFRVCGPFLWRHVYCSLHLSQSWFPAGSLEQRALELGSFLCFWGHLKSPSKFRLQIEGGRRESGDGSGLWEAQVGALGGGATSRHASKGQAPIKPINFPHPVAKVEPRPRSSGKTRISRNPTRPILREHKAQAAKAEVSWTRVSTLSILGDLRVQSL